MCHRSVTESSEDNFQGLILIQSRRVRTREEPAVKDSERSSTPPQHEDVYFTKEVKNDTAIARQDLNKTRSRKKYRQIEKKINAEKAKTSDVHQKIKIPSQK